MRDLFLLGRFDLGCMDWPFMSSMSFETDWSILFFFLFGCEMDDDIYCFSNKFIENFSFQHGTSSVNHRLTWRYCWWFGRWRCCKGADSIELTGRLLELKVFIPKSDPLLMTVHNVLWSFVLLGKRSVAQCLKLWRVTNWCWVLLDARLIRPSCTDNNLHFRGIECAAHCTVPLHTLPRAITSNRIISTAIPSSNALPLWDNPVRITVIAVRS